jgi:hypothetical protein
MSLEDRRKARQELLSWEAKKQRQIDFLVQRGFSREELNGMENSAVEDAYIGERMATEEMSPPRRDDQGQGREDQLIATVKRVVAAQASGSDPTPARACLSFETPGAPAQPAVEKARGATDLSRDDIRTIFRDEFARMARTPQRDRGPVDLAEESEDDDEPKPARKKAKRKGSLRQDDEGDGDGNGEQGRQRVEGRHKLKGIQEHYTDELMRMSLEEVLAVWKICKFSSRREATAAVKDDSEEARETHHNSMAFAMVRMMTAALHDEAEPAWWSTVAEWSEEMLKVQQSQKEVDEQRRRTPERAAAKRKKNDRGAAADGAGARAAEGDN